MLYCSKSTRQIVIVPFATNDFQGWKQNLMLLLTIIAMLDGLIVGMRLTERKQRPVSLLWIVLGIAYGTLAIIAVHSALPIAAGLTVIFAPVVLWILRVIVYGKRG